MQALLPERRQRLAHSREHVLDIPLHLVGCHRGNAPRLVGQFRKAVPRYSRESLPDLVRSAFRRSADGAELVPHPRVPDAVACHPGAATRRISRDGIDGIPNLAQRVGCGVHSSVLFRSGSVTNPRHTQGRLRRSPPEMGVLPKDVGYSFKNPIWPRGSSAAVSEPCCCS